ncbi:MAG: cytochrome b6-f complex iron-sulfur subunit [Pleurocapsa sp.]
MEETFPLESPSMSRRQLLNFLSGAVIATTASASVYTTAKFFVPPIEDGEDGSIVIAKDSLGNSIPASQILAESKGTRVLVAGLAGEPTYLTIVDNGKLDTIGIVNNCTHLGCTFPWNSHDNQFQCPCHGSRYAADGSVVRGSAPLPLKLVTVNVTEDIILISSWIDDDPRTGKKPWWI